MHKLDITKAAAKFIKKLDAKPFRQIVSKILALLENPEPNDSKSLIGYPEYRRADIGEFRIIYRIEDDIVKIAAIGRRNDDDVYRKFKRRHG